MRVKFDTISIKIVTKKTRGSFGAIREVRGPDTRYLFHMTLAALTRDERDVVRCAMEATYRYFDYDFHARLGVSEGEMRDLLDRWPNVDDADDDSCACLAINNAFNDLLNGVGISDNEAKDLTGVNTPEMRRICEKWVSARKWSSTGLR